jgi:type IV secretory pathway VirB10-like protein
MNQPLAKCALGAALGLSLLACLASPAAARQDERQADSRQGPVQPTRNDIQRLQDAVYDAAADLTRLRSSDAGRADELQVRFDDLRDEVVYLKVKLRKEGVTRSEYSTLRNQIDEFRAQVRTAASSAQPEPRGERNYPPPAGTAGGERYSDNDRDDSRPARQGDARRPDEIPAGTEIDVRLEHGLSSDTAQVEDRFTATTIADLYNGNRVLIPAGAAVRGIVTSVNKAGRVERTGKLAIAFDRVTVNGRSYPMHGTVDQALESGGYRQDAGKIGAGAGVGAILGGILGGMKGALAGILIGGGGVVAATEGQDVNLPPGTVLRVRLDSPLSVR